ncbi:unknown [Bacteroides sp. CAG:530]|nr:unknown [Bacteroides sp. CAG:530]
MPNKANLHARKPHKRVSKELSEGVICQTLVERYQKKCFYMYNYKFYHAKEKYYKTYYAGSFNEE